MTALALGDGKPQSSDYLAQSVRTNPVVLRRLLGRLSKAGLVTTKLGVGGGALLALPAAAISLEAIYRAVEDPDVFSLPKSSPNPKCDIGCHIFDVLNPILSRAQRAIEADLSRTTLADVARRIQRAVATSASPAGSGQFVD